MKQYVLRESGITLIEVIVGISIVTAIVAAVGFSITTYVDARAALLIDTKATYLVEEGYEVLRAIRNDDWNTLDSLTVGNTNYLEITSSTIAVVNTPEVIDGQFTRSFIVYPAYRDSDDDLVASTTAGATIDTGAREAVISVFGPTGTTSQSVILTNLFAS